MLKLLVSQPSDKTQKLIYKFFPSFKQNCLVESSGIYHSSQMNLTILVIGSFFCRVIYTKFSSHLSFTLVAIIKSAAFESVTGFYRQAFTCLVIGVLKSSGIRSIDLLFPIFELPKIYIKSFKYLSFLKALNS